MPDENQHGCKEKERIVRGTKIATQQNRKYQEQDILKISCCGFDEWFFVGSNLAKVNFFQLLKNMYQVLTFHNFEIWFVFFISFVEFIQKCHVDLVCLQFTMITEFEADLITSLWG